MFFMALGIMMVFKFLSSCLYIIPKNIANCEIYVIITRRL